jgi:membrane-associated protease RseP (regulator of RpoE activity)
MLSVMTLMEALLIFFTILLSYFTIVFILKKLGILEKYNISLYGPALLLRTKKGINFLKKIATKKRFWRAYSSTGIVFCFICMIIFVFFFIWQFLFVLGLPQETRADILPSAQFYLILPGINPILPFDYVFYILLAFIVAIIVHEFSHGILTLAGDLKVKSMGLLYLIFPIGAFVEPDEEQMKKTTISKRMRVYSVGPFSNFVTFFICLLLFSFVFMSAVQPGVGLTVYEIFEESPAYNLGIKKGAIITDVNGTDITQFKDINEKLFEFKSIINETKANDTITISYIYNNVNYNDVELNLTDSYNYINNNSTKGKGHTGIFSFVNEGGNLGRLQNPFNEPANYFLYFMALPIYGYFEGYNPLVSPFIESYTIAGPLGAIPTSVFWFIVNSLYWIAWLNLMVGIFNILPMVPLDGGFLFNDGIKSIVRKIKKDITEEKSNMIVGKISLFVSLFILLIILSPILLKYI